MMPEMISGGSTMTPATTPMQTNRCSNIILAQEKLSRESSLQLSVELQLQQQQHYAFGGGGDGSIPTVDSAAQVIGCDYKRSVCARITTTQVIKRMRRHRNSSRRQ